MKSPRTEVRQVSKLQAHPMSEKVFGHLSADEFRDMKADIERRGLMHLLELDAKGRVICGGERLRALRELGIQTVTCICHDELVDDIDIEEHLILDNLHRRHLTWSQRYRAGRELERIESTRAQSRMKAGKPQAPEPDAAAKAAKHIGFSESTYERLKKIHESGNTQVIDALDRGSVSVSAAARQVTSQEKKKRTGRPVRIEADDPRTHQLRLLRLQNDTKPLVKFLDLHPLKDFGRYQGDAATFLRGLTDGLETYLDTGEMP